jgi:hypothetical protein
MDPEKGDFFCPHSDVRNHPEKSGLYLPAFKSSPGETLFFTIPSIYPEKRDFSFRFQKEQVLRKNKKKEIRRTIVASFIFNW